MGIIASLPTLRDQSFPPKPTYSTDDIPDLTGKVVIVTGGTAGIGKFTCKTLLEHNAKVYIAARNAEKAAKVMEELQTQTGKEAHFLKVDLASLESIKAAAEEFQRKESQLHILFNNGGVMDSTSNGVTADGYDLQFGTNALGHFYFTKLLLPTLISTAKTSPDKKVRVVTSSSLTHFLHGLDFNTFKDGPAKRRAFSYLLYSQSKFGNVVFGLELARRYGDQGIVSIVLNPGNIKSDLLRNLSLIQQYFASWFMYPTSYGAFTQLWGGTSVEGADFNGKYLRPWARLGKPDPKAEDPELGKQLWTWFEEQVEKL